MKHRILIIEDDHHIVGILEYLLRDEGYDPASAFSGEEGLMLLSREKFNLVILDINLPGIDGLEVCNRIKQHHGVPVIILSCRDQDSDVVSGLELGAEDYIRKPFNHREVILRVNKIMERMTWVTSQRLIITGGLSIDLDREQVERDGKKIFLTPIEFKLISVLASRIGWTISWQILFKKVWQYEDWEGGRELLKVNIRRIRKKIEPDSSHPIYLLNERGKGYRLSQLKAL